MFDVGANADNPLLQEVLLETMKKQLTSWKPHQKTSTTWAFFKVNDNQGVDLKQSQIMCCIVCPDETVGFKILALCTSQKSKNQLKNLPWTGGSWLILSQKPAHSLKFPENWRLFENFQNPRTEDFVLRKNPESNIITSKNYTTWFYDGAIVGVGSPKGPFCYL
jgi:hypothetical protein